MITRIEVDGFKSLRDFAVDLEPFTVLIGPNSAGKSNVLEALALLSRLTSMPIAEAFKQGRGKSIDQFSRRGAEIAEQIRFAVEFLESGDYPRPEASTSGKDAFQSRFRYELAIERRALRSGVERLVVQEESLRAMRRVDDAWMQAHPEFAHYRGYAREGEEIFGTLLEERGAVRQLVGPSTNLYSSDERRIPPTHTAMAAFGGPTRQSILVEENLQKCRMLDLGVSHIGASSERIDSGELSPDASNLPTILAELPSNVLGEIRSDLVSLVPGIASFEVRPEGDELHLDVELSGGERVPARLVSAGTLRLLALLTALRMDPRPYILCIEEPENGIYPGRLRALLDLLLEATSRSYEEEAREMQESRKHVITQNQLPTQIILTTHSPVALAALRSRPQHLRFLDMVRRNGERVTRVRTVGKPTAGDRGRSVIALREIDTLLQSTEVAESEPPA
jgi:predicted ATPase